MANEAVAKSCFVIAPIGGHGTAERKRSDQVLILLRHEFSGPARCAVSRGKSMTTRTSGQIFNER